MEITLSNIIGYMGGGDLGQYKYLNPKGTKTVDNTMWLLMKTVRSNEFWIIVMIIKSLDLYLSNG